MTVRLSGSLTAPHLTEYPTWPLLGVVFQAPLGWVPPCLNGGWGNLTRVQTVKLCIGPECAKTLAGTCLPPPFPLIANTDPNMSSYSLANPLQTGQPNVKGLAGIAGQLDGYRGMLEYGKSVLPTQPEHRKRQPASVAGRTRHASTREGSRGTGFVLDQIVRCGVDESREPKVRGRTGRACGPQLGNRDAHAPLPSNGTLVTRSYHPGRLKQMGTDTAMRGSPLAPYAAIRAPDLGGRLCTFDQDLIVHTVAEAP